MASYNRVIFMGNLTRDPQLSYLPSQTPVVEFGLASNRRWRGQDGSDREDICFIDCRAYGRTADTISKYCKKGSPLLIEGRLQLDQWEKDGQKRSKHRIFVENFTFVGSRGSDGGDGGSESSASSSGYEGTPPADDDIPF
ncbi:MAG: single-stranded DNA-binding protein [Sedimentisphaerales bacterium]|nr:single-stranded DNA-binding protein [Sedimentisphaerales bacterium]